MCDTRDSSLKTRRLQRLAVLRVSKQSRRFIRSILLGCSALALLIWVAVEQFDIPTETMLQLGLVTGLVMLMIITLAAVIAFVWILLRKWRSSKV